MTDNPTNGESSEQEATDSSATGGVSRRRDVMKASAGLVGLGALAGCLDGGDGNGNGGNGNGNGGNGNGDSMSPTETDESGTDEGTPSGETTNIAIVSSPAGFGDNAFNDLALEGLEAASEEYNIEINQVEETNQSNYESTQANLAQSSDPDYDLIVLVSYNHTAALETNAPEYSDQNWMLINAALPEQENVAGYTWANHEMSYQAGVVAGTMTTRELEHDGSSLNPDNKIVGFVGGVDGALINAFEEAYKAGVAWVDDEIEVRVGYIGDYTDTQTANNLATSQYDAGADIVYHAAAAAGQGVFQAAQESNRFAIGVDADQSVTLPDYQDVILGSAVKFINEGTREVAIAVVEDNFSDVQGANVLGLAEEGVAFVPGQTLGEMLPDAVSSNLEETKQAIIDGDIEVPCSAGGC